MAIASYFRSDYMGLQIIKSVICATLAYLIIFGLFIYYDFDMSSKVLCDRLAKEKGVFLTPGFCFEEEHCFRVGFCKNTDVLCQGLQKISEFVSENI